MKSLKILAMALCAAVAVGVTGCSKGPDAVAVDFFETLAAGKAKADAKFFEKHCTKEAAAFLALAGAQVEKEFKGATFKVLETKIDGDKAKVKVEKKQGSKTNTNDIDLVKEDGEWKIAIKK